MRTSSTWIMTSKQLAKLAKKMGWVLTRHGGKHHIYSHKNTSKQVTIPYSTRDWASTLIKKQLQSVWQFNMCHNLPRIGYKAPYNKNIHKGFPNVQQRSNTSLQRTSPSEQVSDERSSSSGSTRSDGSEKLWTTAHTSRQLEHQRQTLSSNSQGAVKRPLFGGRSDAERC